MEGWLSRIGFGPTEIGFVIIVVVPTVLMVRWILRGLADEERRRYKRFFAVLLIYPTAITCAAAGLSFWGAMVNRTQGNIAEFQNLLAIGFPLSIAGVVLLWCMFRWPEWNK